MKNKFLLLNNVNSILDLFKILAYYIDDKKILEIRNKDNIFSKFCRVAFLKILRSNILFLLSKNYYFVSYLK